MKQSSVEILESRIAPALFFVSSASLSVVDAHGNDAMNLANETTANSVAGTDVALLLGRGDQLVFDANHNHRLDARDSILISVTAGRAMAFLHDTDGDHAFGRGDVTGLAVGQGFHAKIAGDINGDIVTALDADGNFTA